MRQGAYEVQVCPANNPSKPFNETVIDGKTYVHAEPGEYRIHVRVAEGCEDQVQGKLLRTDVSIDGVSPNVYIPLTDLDRKTCLHRILDRFYFANKSVMFSFQKLPTSTANEEQLQTEVEPNLGLIEVGIYEAEERTRVEDANKGGNFTEIRASAIPDEKKFWKHPSLFTGGGTIVEQAEGPWLTPTYYYRLGKVCIIQLCYHTAGTIRILKNIAKQGEFPINATSASSLGKKRKRAGRSTASKRKVIKHEVANDNKEVIDLTMEEAPIEDAVWSCSDAGSAAKFNFQFHVRYGIVDKHADTNPGNTKPDQPLFAIQHVIAGMPVETANRVFEPCSVHSSRASRNTPRRQKTMSEPKTKPSLTGILNHLQATNPHFL